VQNFPQGTTQPDVGTFFTTADGGLTWTESAPVPVVANDSVVTMTCASDGKCIAVTYAGSAGTSGPINTVRSTDFGRTWVTEPSASLLLAGGQLFASCGDTVHCMMVGSGSSKNVVIASTANGGQTWQVGAAPAGWDTYASSMSCATGSDCYVSTNDDSNSNAADAVIEATSDAGATWTTLNLPTVNGAGLGMVQPLSCPSADGCIGVGALSGQPSSVLVSSLPSAS
jgi:hypothetical protein